MAALTLAAGFAATLAADADAANPPEPGTQKVTLTLRIRGLGRRGCDVEIKPAHAGCSFRPRVEHVPSDGMKQIVLDDVRSSAADRDCSFAITIREPGHADKTIRRGCRLAPVVAGRPTPPQTLNCYISSPSFLARNSDGRTRR